MAEEGITRGCNPPVNDRYCPDARVTRGQMAAFLVRALGLTERLDNPFTDDDGSIFEADIERLAAAGITRGLQPAGQHTVLSGCERHPRADGGIPGPCTRLHRRRRR